MASGLLLVAEPVPPSLWLRVVLTLNPAPPCGLGSFKP